MKGKSALFWLGLAGVAGAVLFQTSYEVQGLEEELASLNRKIVAEQEAIQILKAEWSFMNDPGRLENLARVHLNLRPTDAKQFVAGLEAVPLRATPAVPVPPPAIAPSAPMAGPAPLPHVAKLPAESKPAKPMVIPASATASATPKLVQPAAQPQKAPAPAPKTLAAPANAKPTPAPGPATAPAQGDLGVLIARLGGTR